MKMKKCVAWVDTKSIESLDSQMSFYTEAANVFGYELQSFYGDDGNKGIEFMLNEILDKGINTIITKSIASLCQNLDSGINIVRKIFQNTITIVDVSTTEEMKNMSDFINCLCDELYRKEVAYNMQDEWTDYSFDEIFSNNIEYGELLRMDEGVY